MLGTVLINEKKYKDAITVLEPLTKDAAYVNPYFAWGNLGWAQLEDGQIDASITSLKNAVGTEPRFCVGHYRLGLALEKKGDPLRPSRACRAPSPRTRPAPISRTPGRRGGACARSRTSCRTPGRTTRVASRSRRRPPRASGALPRWRRSATRLPSQ
jgi:hypothetical protein